MIKIAIQATSSAEQSKVLQLATNLALPLASEVSYPLDFILLISDQGLSLQKVASAFKPLKIDFSKGKQNYRRKLASLKKEALARAMGLKTAQKPTILDATAGLGQDSFLLASLGFNVTLLERHPLVHALLADGLQRAAVIADLEMIVKRLTLIHTDASSWLKALTPEHYPDIIYLDPMFPGSNKSALAKKEMQFFHELLGTTPEADIELFNIALTRAKQRVVVKRPRLAASLAGKTPSYALTGRSNRFDVYLSRLE